MIATVSVALFSGKDIERTDFSAACVR